MDPLRVDPRTGGLLCPKCGWPVEGRGVAFVSGLPITWDSQGECYEYSARVRDADVCRIMTL